jgi:outer membrane protein OmpA-like peptidoglycan-associated protein
VSNDPRNPKVPPDDFGATVPNFRLPQNKPPQPSQPPTDFGQTMPNFKPQSNQPPPTNQPIKQPPPNYGDYGQGRQGSERNAPRDFNSTYTDFGSTRSDIGAPREEYGQPTDYGATQSNMSSSNRQDFSKTMPYFKLPEAEMPKPFVAEKEPTATEEKKKRGFGWLFLLAGLFGLFLIIAAAAGISLYLRQYKGYTVIVTGAQPRSDVFVDDAHYGVTDEKGTNQLQNLKAGEHTIVIKKEGFADFALEKPIKGENGDVLELPASQVAIKKVAPPDECANFKPNEIDKADRCTNIALDKLPPNFSVEDLLKALNLLIINFGTGKFDIPPARMTTLQKASDKMKLLPAGTVIEVGGHTDNVGNDTNNQKLSENRANAVKTALVGFGVKPEMLTMKGYGSKSPKVANDSDEHKFQNRRIEYKAVSSPGK